MAICLLIFLSGCSYSSKSVITIQGVTPQLQVELDEYVKALRRHRDGCFAERVSTMLVRGPANQQKYLISSGRSAMDLSLSVNSNGDAIVVELNEWSERRFSPYVASCYKTLVSRMATRFGAENLKIVESCSSGSCR